MIIKTKLVHLKKPTLIFNNKNLEKNKEYFFEFIDFDYSLKNPYKDNPRKIKRRLQLFDKKQGFDIGIKIKGFLDMEYDKKYNIKIL